MQVQFTHVQILDLEDILVFNLSVIFVVSIIFKILTSLLLFDFGLRSRYL